MWRSTLAPLALALMLGAMALTALPLENDPPPPVPNTVINLFLRASDEFQARHGVNIVRDMKNGLVTGGVKMSDKVWLEEGDYEVELSVKIFERNNANTAYSVLCWQVKYKLPDGRTVIVFRSGELVIRGNKAGIHLLIRKYVQPASIRMGKALVAFETDRDANLHDAKEDWMLGKVQWL